MNTFGFVPPFPMFTWREPPPDSTFLYDISSVAFGAMSALNSYSCDGDKMPWNGNCVRPKVKALMTLAMMPLSLDIAVYSEG